MATIVLGLWTSHGPTLSTTPDQWSLNEPADRAKTDHPFRGCTYGFEQLAQIRSKENLAEQSSLEERTRRSNRCSAAVAAMADAFEAARPDVAVIMGNDQHELFLNECMPAITIFNGPMMWNQPCSPEQAARGPAGTHEGESGHRPPAYTEYPGHPVLARRMIESATRAGFDIATSEQLPNHPGHWSSGIGHAFGFVYRQIMRDRVIPNVPIVFNTFFPPNQPTARRCFELGRLVGRVIRTWPRKLRVAIVGSGGMSHFVIDEQLDQRIFSALRNRDAEALCSIEEEWLQSGSSEIKNWIAAAGALFATDLRGDVVDYVPCYHSEAGTGTANGFVCWR